MNVRISAAVLLILAVASAAQDKPEKPKTPRKISTKKQVEMLAEALATMAKLQAEQAKLQAEQHDEVMKTLLLIKDDSCLTTRTTAACPQPTTSSLGGAACDVTTEGGPWTVVQRRTVGDVLFNMPWADYKVGFGSLDGDHWIGNDALNELCPPNRPCQLRVEVTFPGKPYEGSLTTQPDGVYTALYGSFAVEDAKDKYRLLVEEFDDTASTAGDALTYHHYRKFSTLDADNDVSPHPCSMVNGQAGWWFRECGHSINGRWREESPQGVVWFPVTGYHSAIAARMLVRPAA